MPSSPSSASRRFGRRSAPALLLAAALGLAGAPAAAADDPPYGWPWLRNALDALRPSVDTRLPESSTQAAERLERQIDQGDAAGALAEIDRRLAERKASTISGTDVRLVFLRARALAALGRIDDAAGVYRQMTIDFPELPEPWNNLAVLLVSQNRLEPAADALHMALRTWPDYPAAQANLGDVLLLQARAAYQRAAELGMSGAATQVRHLDSILSPGTQTP
ncbi:MAG: tetratricopeptide repeat protein [Pigmentiphaga sp.]|nr:tetratricopeptide repeat protein [Pigmentiphaga sp.]